MFVGSWNEFGDGSLGLLRKMHRRQQHHLKQKYSRPLNPPPTKTSCQPCDSLTTNNLSTQALASQLSLSFCDSISLKFSIGGCPNRLLDHSRVRRPVSALPLTVSPHGEEEVYCVKIEAAKQW
ncbi:hypothetical protein L6452_38913 [Arctium lappa]|uniref:Uncharacterized protein n=1 Tax=Arctium lappa TaxID=4217 RepID=A0ACB8XUY6_ARCLA|nr:hypothetical protein L6452_38913 [Arctium lappa]